MVKGISGDSVSRQTSGCSPCDCLSMVVSVIIQVVSGIFSCFGCGGRPSSRAVAAEQPLRLPDRVSPASRDQYRKNADYLKTQSTTFDSKKREVDQLQSNTLEALQRKKEEGELENVQFSQRCGSIKEKFNSVKAAFKTWEENARQVEERVKTEFPGKEKWLEMSSRGFSGVETSFEAQLRTAKAVLSTARSMGCGLSKDAQESHLGFISHSIDFLKKIIPLRIESARKNIDSCEFSEEQKKEYFTTYSRGIPELFLCARELVQLCGDQESASEFRDLITKYQIPFLDE